MVPSQNHTTIMPSSRGNCGTRQIRFIGEDYGNAGGFNDGSFQFSSQCGPGVQIDPDELFDVTNPSPCPAALCLRGGWSMGQVRDSYYFASQPDGREDTMDNEAEQKRAVDVKTLTGQVERKGPKGCKPDAKLLLRGNDIHWLDQDLNSKINYPKTGGVIVASDEEASKNGTRDHLLHDPFVASVR